MYLTTTFVITNQDSTPVLNDFQCFTNNVCSLFNLNSRALYNVITADSGDAPLSMETHVHRSPV